MGRVTEVLPCPAGTTLERHDAACDATDLDPAGGPSIDPPPLPHMPTEAERRLAAARCAQHRVKACSVRVEGPPGSHALACRDAQKLITGPVHLIAPDGSVLAEGACAANVATGSWITWRGGEVDSVVGYDAGRMSGVLLQRVDGAYRSEISAESPGAP